MNCRAWIEIYGPPSKTPGRLIVACELPEHDGDHYGGGISWRFDVAAADVEPGVDYTGGGIS